MNSDATRKRQARQESSTVVVDWDGIDWGRRLAAAADLGLWIKTYLAPFFYVPMPELDGLLLPSLQENLTHGGRDAVAAPRGSGKTARTMAGILWALLNGHQRCGLYCSVSASQAAEKLETLTGWLDGMGLDALAQDYPEVVAFVRGLEGTPQRAKALRDSTSGQRAAMVWTTERVVLPSVSFPDLPSIPAEFRGKPSPASGATIIASGLDAGLRGRLGRNATRPGFAIIDDPLAEDEAGSASVLRRRRNTIDRSLTRMRGPSGPMSLFYLGTVMEPGDLTDEMTDRQKRPSWNGRRLAAVIQWPKAKDMWDHYVELRRESQRQLDDDGQPTDRHGRAAHRYYLEHQTKMDAGAEMLSPLAFPGAHIIDPATGKCPNILPDGTPIAASAIESIYQVVADDGMHVVLSEFQNAPEADDTQAAPLTVDAIMARINRHRRWWMPSTVEHLVGKIDVGDSRLHLTIVAGEPNGTPYLVHRQTWPEAANKTLADLYPGLGIEARIYQGLEDLAAAAVLPERARVDGTPMKVQRLHVDNGHRPRLVERWCRQGCCHGIAHPEGGAKTGVLDAPLNKWRPRPGERRGDGWLIQPARNGLRSVIVDSNQWKTYLFDRLQTPLGAPGALTLYGENPETHRELAEHCTAEYSVLVAVGGTSRTVWKPRPGGLDNHYFDALYGSMCALSIQGCQVRPGGDTKRKAKPVVRAHVSMT